MGGAKCCAARRRADAVADPHVEPTQPGDLARDDPISPHHRAALEHFDAGDLGLVAPELQALAIVESTGEHPDIGELFAARAALDLEHGAAGRTFDIADRGRQQLDEGREQRLDAGPGDGRAHEYRVDEAGAALPLQCAVQAVMGQAAVVDIGGQHGLVMLGQPLGEPLAKASIVGTERDEGGGSGAEPLPHAHRHDIGRQPPGDRRAHPSAPASDEGDFSVEICHVIPFCIDRYIITGSSCRSASSDLFIDQYKNGDENGATRPTPGIRQGRSPAQGHGSVLGEGL